MIFYIISNIESKRKPTYITKELPSEIINGRLMDDIVSTIDYLKIKKISKIGLTMSKLFGRASPFM